MLYTELLQKEAPFRNFMHREYRPFNVVLKNAIKNGEIKKEISMDFILKVFNDIYCRSINIFDNEEKNLFKVIIWDIENFYDLIKA